MHSSVKKKFFGPNRQTEEGNQPATPPDPIPTISLPHNKFTSEYLNPVLKGNKFRVVTPSSNSLQNLLVSNKPTTLPQSDPSLCSGVYKVPCLDCEHCYYGETGRSFETRLGEHKSAVRNLDRKNACSKHVQDTNHQIDWKNAKTVYNSDD